MFGRKRKIKIIPRFIINILAIKITKISEVLSDNWDKIDLKELKAILKHVKALETEVKDSINVDECIQTEEATDEEKKSFEDELKDRKI